MTKERYVGERRALWHFLSELQPLVMASLGGDALLRHRIDRAVTSGDLEQLRNARRMFHHLPDDLKRRLMRGIFEGSSMGSVPITPPSDPINTLAPEQFNSTEAAIRFSAFPAARSEDVALSVELENQNVKTDAPIQVMIKPGTLPKSAAETLRQVANWIEHDRRLLSAQHWAGEEKRATHSDETLDQA